MSSIASEPSLVEYENMRFLIMDSPTDSNLHVYLRLCKKHNVTQLVRISEPRYRKEEVEKAGITLHEMYFEDGASPPQDIIDRWLQVVSGTFDGATPASESEKPCIAVHCVAGLGRAPVLVTLAMIERGMDAISGVQYIRSKRRGAINAVQLSYLESYEPSRKKGKKCIIM